MGKVSYYSHHNGWWVYYSENGEKVRRRVADDEKTAAQVAAQINGHLMTQAPTFFSFQPITIFNLQKEFIDHHEHVLRSSLATVKRYRTATQHLVTFSQVGQSDTFAHELNADEFVRYIRSIQVSPNGHKNARCRPLRDKGVRYILDCCRSMFNFAAKKRHLPPYADSPFLGLGGKRFKIEDAKRIFVFDEQTELTFLKGANWWSFPIFFTLAKLGVRPGELTHILIEEVDLDSGWIHIRNKVELGWRIKTGAERSIPIPPELVAVLRRVMNGRTKGPVFIRHQYLPDESSLGNVGLNRLCETVQARTNTAQLDSEEILTREQLAKIQRGVWRDLAVSFATGIIGNRNGQTVLKK
ncbi:MAG: hypothetical protein COA78_17780 [Blastopirellula sp.]|nr:MAG: hypothetical protein COA78_17780 [Blastopirellula sp.]